MSDFAFTIPRRFNGGSIRAVIQVLKVWNLTCAQSSQLLGVNEKEFLSWKIAIPSERDLSHEIILRVSYLLGIYKALHIIIPNKILADSWIQQPNKAPLFDGATPLTRMLQGNIEDLQVVRVHLDSNIE